MIWWILAAVVVVALLLSFGWKSSRNSGMTFGRGGRPDSGASDALDAARETQRRLGQPPPGM